MFLLSYTRSLFFYFTLDLYSLPRTYTVYLGQYDFHLGQYGVHVGSMQKFMQLIGQYLSQLNHVRSLFEVCMLDRPSFYFGNSKICVLSWGYFDLRMFGRSESSPPLGLYGKHTKIF